MKPNTTTYHTDREKLEAVIELLNPRKRRNYKRDTNETMQEVSFQVTNNDELRYMISCLLRVCILALEGDNDFCSPRLTNCSKDLTIATILDLVDSILPDEQLESYDAIEELLLTK